jgi:hypothetical protein
MSDTPAQAIDEILEPRVTDLGEFSVRRLLLIGGDPLGRRHISWNFVHSSKQRIAQAAEGWRAGRFPNVPGDDEFIPLPA